MKQTILNTFAAIGIITTFVLACSAVLDNETGSYYIVNPANLNSWQPLPN